MDPDRYCLDEAAPPGSSLYYATLFVGARERAALVAVHALRRTLLGIVDAIADPNVRAHKLNWWSDEIMEARDGRPRHPVSVAITRHGGELLWRRREMLMVLSAVARLSAADGFASEEGRDRFCEDVGGGTALLCAAVTLVETPDGYHALGAALEHAMLAGAPASRSGLLCPPDGAPTPADGMGHPRGPDSAKPVSQRLVDVRERARATLADALRPLQGRGDPAALAYRTLARIQLATLARVMHARDRERPHRPSITPIRKLWIAWQAARRGR